MILCMSLTKDPVFICLVSHTKRMVMIVPSISRIIKLSTLIHCPNILSSDKGNLFVMYYSNPGYIQTANIECLTEKDT